MTDSHIAKTVRKIYPVLFATGVAAGCLAQLGGAATNAVPQFIVLAGDIGSRVTAGWEPLPNGTNAVVHVHLVYQAPDLEKFTSEHLHQRVQFLVETKTNVYADLVITNKISNGQIDLSCASPDEAKAMVQFLQHF